MSNASSSQPLASATLLDLFSRCEQDLIEIEGLCRDDGSREIVVWRILAVACEVAAIAVDGIAFFARLGRIPVVQARVVALCAPECNGNVVPATVFLPAHLKVLTKVVGLLRVETDDLLKAIGCVTERSDTSVTDDQGAAVVAQMRFHVVRIRILARAFVAAAWPDCDAAVDPDTVPCSAIGLAAMTNDEAFGTDEVPAASMERLGEALDQLAALGGLGSRLLRYPADTAFAPDMCR